jgi:hypothetical protein
MRYVPVGLQFLRIADSTLPIFDEHRISPNCQVIPEFAVGNFSRAKLADIFLSLGPEGLLCAWSEGGQER